MQEHDAAVLLLLPEVREGGEVDEVAEVVARVFGYAEVGSVLCLGSAAGQLTYHLSRNTSLVMCLCKGGHEV